MTKADLEALIADIGGEEHVVGLTFDNSIVYTFGKGGKLMFHLSDCKTIGNVDYYCPPYNFQSKSVYGGGYDIPAHAYHPLECLQAITTIDNVKDLKKIDAAQYHDFNS